MDRPQFYLPPPTLDPTQLPQDYPGASPGYPNPATLLSTPQDAAAPYPGYQPVVRGFADRLALALQDLPALPTMRRKGQPQGSSFLLGLLHGAAGGYSSAGMARMSEREKLNAALAQKAHDENAANLRATEAAAAEARTTREHQVNRLFDIAHPQPTKPGAAAAKTHEVTAADAKRLPFLKPYVGETMTTAEMVNLEKPKKAAAPKVIKPDNQKMLDLATAEGALKTQNDTLGITTPEMQAGVNSKAYDVAAEMLTRAKTDADLRAVTSHIMRYPGIAEAIRPLFNLKAAEVDSGPGAVDESVLNQEALPAENP